MRPHRPHSPPPPLPAPRGEPVWAVRLLGAVEARNDHSTLSHWPSRAAASLLARLALQPERLHTREQLTELLWPGIDTSTGRRRLRQTLSTLKALLQPPGVGVDVVAVLDIQPGTIGVLPGALSCDAVAFERHLRAGDASAAAALYRGELMPGFYDDWIHTERQRLAAQFERLAVSEVPAPRAAGAPGDKGNEPWSPTGAPSYTTRAFGIDERCQLLQGLMHGTRLVTVMGPGGSGKTRLAAQTLLALRAQQGVRNSGVAAGQTTGNQAADEAGRPAFERISFVPLAGCAGPAPMLEACCSALQLMGHGPALARIVGALTDRRALLVLDNAEQLDLAATQALQQLLVTLPGLHLLVTSRRLLALDGEQVFELDGLPVPAPDAGAAEAATHAAVGLFVDRARASRAGFSLGPGNTPAVVALVRLLGGMPLGIELAASRLRSLAPAELLARLVADVGTPMLDLLARGSGRGAAADQRHASMRQVVASSWHTLTPTQARLLARMSVLTGAARVDLLAAADTASPADTQQRLNELHDASMVRAEQSAADATRYGLLQPVREFAAEHLDPDEAKATRQRVRRWLSAWADRTVHADLRLMEAEMAHVHAAITSAPADGDGAAALALAAALVDYWDADYLPLSDQAALRLALTQTQDADLLADACTVLSIAGVRAGLKEAALADADTARQHALDDRRKSWALVAWVNVRANAGAPADEMDPVLEQALAHAVASADPATQALVLDTQAVLAVNFRLDYARGAALCAQAEQLWQTAGSPRVMRARMNRASVIASLGDDAQAVELFEACERSAHAERHWLGILNVPWQLGRVLIRLRRWDEAAAALRRGLRLSWERLNAPAVAWPLLHLPEALAMTGEPETAARLQGFAVAHWERNYGPINRIQAREMKLGRRMLCQQLGAAAVQALRAEGAAWPLAHAVREALAGPPG